MNIDIKNWPPRKKLIAVLILAFAIVGIIVTIFLVQRQQDLRSRAEKATILTLAPPNQNVDPGKDAKLDLVINPGTNQVNFVKFSVKFNPDKFDTGGVIFNVDTDSPLKPFSEPNLEAPGQATFTLGVGSDPTKVVRSTIKLGSLTLPVKADAAAGVEQVSFNEDQTQVRSTLGADAFNENVLSSTTPATITITGGVCVPNVGTCAWSLSDGANSYHYIVMDVDENKIVEEGDVDSSITSIEFPSEPGKTYKCEVSAVTECGTGEPGEATSECPLPSATPTPGPTGTPTPTSEFTPTPSTSATPTPTGVLTPTPVPSSTPTPTTPFSTGTPTPTSVNTPTPTTPSGGIETPTPAPTTEFGATVTPIPTLPPTGNPLVLSGIIGGILFILGGFVLLFL